MNPPEEHFSGNRDKKYLQGFFRDIYLQGTKNALGQVINLTNAMTGRKPGEYLARDIMEVTLKYGFDGVFTGYGGFGGYNTTNEFDLDVNHYRDDWGTVYQKTTCSWPIDAHKVAEKIIQYKSK